MLQFFYETLDIDYVDRLLLRGSWHEPGIGSCVLGI